MGAKSPWYWGPGLSVVWLVLLVGALALGGRSTALGVWVVWAVATTGRAALYGLRGPPRRTQAAEVTTRDPRIERLQQERAELERTIREASRDGASGSTRLAELVRRRDEIDRRLRGLEHG